MLALVTITIIVGVSGCPVTLVPISYQLIWIRAYEPPYLIQGYEAD